MASHSAGDAEPARPVGRFRIKDSVCDAHTRLPTHAVLARRDPDPYASFQFECMLRSDRNLVTGIAISPVQDSTGSALWRCCFKMPDGQIERVHRVDEDAEPEKGSL